MDDPLTLSGFHTTSSNVNKSTNNETCRCRQKLSFKSKLSACMFSMKYSAVVNTSTAQNYFGTSKRSFKERYITITRHHLETNR